MSENEVNQSPRAVSCMVTCIDVFDSNVVSIMRGICETGKLKNANDCAISEDIANNDLLNLFLSEIRSIDIDPNIHAANYLQRARAQVRLFEVPDGPLGITVSEVPQSNGGIVGGLMVLEVENMTYFSPGDVISGINGVSVRNLTPELAVAMLSQTKNRKLIVVRTHDSMSTNVSADVNKIQEDKIDQRSFTSQQPGSSVPLDYSTRAPGATITDDSPRSRRALSSSPSIRMYSATYLGFYTKMRHKFDSPYSFLSANKLLDNRSCFMT
jgi:hypothetical protein